jgi:hypothetical protein
MGNLKQVLLATVLVGVVMPAAFCIMRRFELIDAMGPIVFGYGIFEGFLFAMLVPFYVVPLAKQTWLNLVLIPVGIVLGVLLAVLLFNVFIGLTMLFGVMDYQLM